MKRDIVLSPAPGPRPRPHHAAFARADADRARRLAAFGREPLAWPPGRIDAFRDAVAEREVLLRSAGEADEADRCAAALGVLGRAVEHACRDLYDAGLAPFAAALASGVPPWPWEPPDPGAAPQPATPAAPAEDAVLDDGALAGWFR